MVAKTTEGQLTLTQMLKALDKDVASGIERKLKKLSKKKAVKVPLNKNKADQIARKIAYESVSKEVSSWESIVEKNKKAKQLKFPLDEEPEVLPSAAESLGQLKPSNPLEEEVMKVMRSSDTALHDNAELSKAEEKYLKAISAEEAQERHRELQRMRVLLSSYAAKMRRQKAIKSKSYRRLLKHERIRRHVKRVESDKDLLMDEIERLKRLRAQERASLRHKNTGKWAKHAKFRTKYDEAARNALVEQIGLAEKSLKKPAEAETSSEEENDDDDDDDDNTDSLSQSSNELNQDENVTEDDHLKVGKSGNEREVPKDCIMLSSELDINDKLKKRKPSQNPGTKAALDDIIEMNDDDDDVMDDEEEEDGIRQLMSEAFANDDVVSEFKKTKDRLVDEEQPKDVDNFLPGWGSWAGPGVKISKNKRKKFIVKAKRRPRKDDNLGNVIISEEANSKMKDLMVKKLPRGIKSEKQLEKILTRPTAATFINQSSHRDSIKPRVSTRMGARIEPMSKKMLRGGNKAKWAA